MIIRRWQIVKNAVIVYIASHSALKASERLRREREDVCMCALPKSGYDMYRSSASFQDVLPSSLCNLTFCCNHGVTISSRALMSSFP